MSEPMGFPELRAPVYSKTLVDERGQPLLLGYAPVRWDTDCPSRLAYRIDPRAGWRFQGVPIVLWDRG